MNPARQKRGASKVAPSNRQRRRARRFLKNFGVRIYFSCDGLFMLDFIAEFGEASCALTKGQIAQTVMASIIVPK
jgi:hypothetical protein